ncbi:hypothetical protein CERSUDRAFT_94462 [Gelatoporia subvermispora B]|uniref:MgsA AAA+ ATPase C-terminal domain-containing protein n=1 Tax=Ceriporiopsis subvermispora (strain B) TaxID=914234 RepID=M2RG86_CERS8|nr:hypothetical protein CERSUDRAFT_94462 [Gelatoporia subvermispora B]
MTVYASEDVGLADNHALPLAVATLQACQTIGMPECRINLAHLVAYLSEAPNSTYAYEVYNRAEEAAKRDMMLPVPLPVRNVPPGLMKELGYVHGYHYSPDSVLVFPACLSFRRELLIDCMCAIITIRRQTRGKTDELRDEDTLRKWEQEENRGQPWEGMPDAET